MLELVQRLKTYLPSELNSFFFWNSGAEAVEAAIKTARFATKKTNIIAFQGAYHGRTYGLICFLFLFIHSFIFLFFFFLSILLFIQYI